MNIEGSESDAIVAGSVDPGAGSPKFDRAIVAARRQDRAVGRKRDRVHSGLMPVERQ